MAFFGKVGSSTHGETTFKYLTFGVVGVDWISLGSRIRGENSASALRVCAFQTHAGRVRFRARFPSQWPKPSMEHLSVDRSPKFSSKERKRRLVGGRGGFGLLPLAARLSGYQPIHPSTRPSIADRQANLSVFQRAETRDQCAFPFRRNFRVENRCRRIGSCGSVADGEEMSATRILYKRKKRNNRRGFHPLAYPRRAHARAKVVGKGGAHGYVHVCRINIYYVSRVRYLNTWGKSDSESRLYSRDFIFRMHSSLQISTTRKPVSLGAREICWKIVASGRGDVARARNNLVTCPEHDNFFSFNPRIGRRYVARICTDEINRGRSRGKLLFLLVMVDFRTWKSV